MNNLYFIGMIFEGIIIVLISCLFTLIVIKYNKNRNKLILLLFFLCLNIFLAIVFSWLSKVLILYSNIDYLYDDSVSDPLTPASWILLRISDFRISFLFITIATIFSYFFKVKLFEKDFKKFQSFIILIYGIFTAFFSLVIYQKDNIILDVFTFFFVFLLMCIVYIPFMKKSIQAYKNTSMRNYRNAFLSLTIMSLSFILVLFCFLIDRIYILMGDFGFTLFYFMGWIFLIIGILGAYFGYLYFSENKNKDLKKERER